ncbi:hypothetical protein Ancab_036916 [Ancistrocladus abbreviatus]
MEASQSLATESFSFSWLVNSNPKIEIPEDSNDLVMDDHTVLKRSCYETQSFHFNVCVPEQSNDPPVCAEKLFANELIMPVSINSSENTTETVGSPFGDRSPSVWSHRFLLKKWQKSSKKILQKYFRFLVPLCPNRTELRRNARVDDLDSRASEVMSLSSTPAESPRSSTTYYNSRGNLSDTESSVHEAILYCKRSCVLQSNGFLIFGDCVAQKDEMGSFLVTQGNAVQEMSQFARAGKEFH